MFLIVTPTSVIVPSPWFAISEEKPDGVYGSWSKLMRATGAR